jgi:glycosyltransferase involved in cell wall biosynthesis
MSATTEIGTSRIRVGWFASGFVGRSASGTSYVARKAVTYLLAEHANSFEIVLFTKNKNESEAVKSDTSLLGATIIQLPEVRSNLMQGSRQFYKYCRTKNSVVDILHFSAPRVYPFFWRFPASKFICTFHAAGDVTVKPDKFVLSRHIYNFIIRRQWKHFDAIIALSEFARNEIIINYGVAKAAVRIIPPGADSFIESGTRSVRSLVGKSKIVTIMGRWQTFKNVGKAAQHIQELNETIDEKFHLVLIGKSNVMGGDHVAKIISKFDNEYFTAIEYLEPEELNWVFSNSKLVVIPSLNEGFGLPSFEAFAGGATILVHRGTPASTILSRQDGVFSCDMSDPSEIQEHVNKIISIEDLPQISSRVELLRNLNMTWDGYGRSISELYLEQTNY